MERTAADRQSEVSDVQLLDSCPAAARLTFW